MSRLAFALAALLPLAAGARPWNGILPGGSSLIDVLGRFGEPTKTPETWRPDVVVYTGPRAIKGTTQVQFRIDPGTKTVKRIDVYPEPVITTAEIERSYGKACDLKRPVQPCYYRKVTPSKTPYFLYLAMGLTIFLRDDGTVKSFAFLPEAP